MEISRYRRCLISKNKTKKIVFIGKELSDVKSFLNRKLATQEMNVGTYSKEKIYFNDIFWLYQWTNNKTLPAFSYLLTNMPISAIAVMGINNFG